MPDQFEHCAERRYFTELHYLALVCDSDILERRLRTRPAWRQAGTAAFVDRMIEFNDYLRDTAGTSTPSMAIVDTTHRSIDESTAMVMEWVRRWLP
jgi:hypothetical protein